MTFARFKQIWSAVKWPRVRNPTIVDNGTPRCNAALRKVAKGERTDFVEIAQRLSDAELHDAVVRRCFESGNIMFANRKDGRTEIHESKP